LGVLGELDLRLQYAQESMRSSTSFGPQKHPAMMRLHFEQMNVR
jgi:hypothetical protein